MFSEGLESLSRRNLQPFPTSNQKLLMEHSGLVAIRQGKKNTYGTFENLLILNQSFHGLYPTVLPQKIKAFLPGW